VKGPKHGKEGKERSEEGRVRAGYTKETPTWTVRNDPSNCPPSIHFTAFSAKSLLSNSSAAFPLFSPATMKALHQSPLLTSFTCSK